MQNDNEKLKIKSAQKSRVLYLFEKFFKKRFQKKHLFFLIILVAIFFRFWQLNQTPPGLYPDVATNGTDAIAANQNLDYKIFYPANNGREGLFINLIAISFKIFGVGIWQLRLVGALIGVLTVYGVYLLTKEILDERAALLASFFMATSFWAVNFSRIGFRAIMVPFILVFSFYFLLRNLTREKQSRDFIISGIIFGLGFYTYISFKIAPLILIVLLGYFLVRDRKLIKIYWKQVILFLFIAALVALPIFYLQFASPNAVLRTSQVSIFNPEVNKGNFGGTLFKTTALSLGMFNFYGDPNWRHNFSGLPALNFFVGIFFLVGFIIFVKLLLEKKEELKKKFAGFFLLSWFFIMLIPAILTEEGMPHSLRSIGSMVPVFIMAGFGVSYIFDTLSKIKKDLAKKIIVILISAIIISDFSLYFIVWAKRPEVIDQFTTKYVEIGKFLNEIPESTDKYVVINEAGSIVSGFPVQAQTIKFITYQKSNIILLNEEDLKKIEIKKQSVVVDLKNDKKIKELLAANSSAKETKETQVLTASQSTNFVVYFVE